MISKRLIPALIVLSISACAISGCFDGGYGGYGAPGYSYGYAGYPASGYAPYAWNNRGYAPDFAAHHPWEEHHDFGGHRETFYHAPVARAGDGGGHAVQSRGGGRHGGNHR
jgi:hypothetical protein